jgi:PAS domain S-box-containing protein
MTIDARDAEQAEPVALEAKQYLARLIDSSPDAIISTDKDGNVALFSERAEALLGYRAREITGRSISVLYGDAAGARQVALEMRKHGGTVSSLESIIVTKDGNTIPVLISASFLFNEKGEEAGTVGFIRDLRERKREEEAFDELSTELKRARERFQYVLTVTPGVIYTTQASGNYACTFVSENVDAVMGFSPWEMIEEPQFWVSRLHPDDAHWVLPEMQSLIKQGAGTIEYRLRNRDKSYIWIRDTFRVIHDDTGRPLELVGSWADISYHKQAEQALGERTASSMTCKHLSLPVRQSFIPRHKPRTALRAGLLARAWNRPQAICQERCATIRSSGPSMSTPRMPRVCSPMSSD